MLILGVALEQAQVRVLTQKHGVRDAVVDGVAGRFAALDVTQVLVAMSARLELDHLARRVLDLQIVNDGLPLRPVARLKLHQLRVLLGWSLVGRELHLVLLEHQLVVDVEIVVVLNHVVVLLDEAAGVGNRDARGLVVVVLAAALDLLEAPLELVVLVHLLQVDGHVLDLVGLLEGIAELFVVAVRNQLLVVQVELGRPLILLELLEIGFGDDDLGLLFANLIAVDGRLLLAQLVLLLLRDPLGGGGVDGLLLGYVVGVQSHHGPPRGVALVPDELLLEQLRVVLGVSIRAALLLGAGGKVGLVERVGGVVVLDSPLRLDLVLHDRLLARLLLNILSARLDLYPLTILLL